MPDLANDKVRAVEIRLGAFNYDMYINQEANDAALVTKNPVELDNKTIYLGQWNSANQRQGRGT